MAATLSVRAVVNTNWRDHHNRRCKKRNQITGNLHSRRHQTGMRTAVDKMLHGLVGIRAEKVTMTMTRPPWK